MITTDDAVVVQVAGSAGGAAAWQWLSATPAGIRSRIVDELSTWFRVQSFTWNAPTDLLGSWDYTAQVRVAPWSDYGDAADIASVIASAFADVTTYLPTATVVQTIAGGATDSSLPPIGNPGGNGAPSASMLGTLGFFLVGIIVVLALIPRAARSVGL